MIGTEVSEDYVDKTFQEIFYEMELLREKLISRKELEMVRNYLLGRILNFIDGPFNTGRLLKSIILSDLKDTYFSELVSTIKNVSALDLRDMARKYLREEDMWCVTVG